MSIRNVVKVFAVVADVFVMIWTTTGLQKLAVPLIQDLNWNRINIAIQTSTTSIVVTWESATRMEQCVFAMKHRIAIPLSDVPSTTPIQNQQWLPLLLLCMSRHHRLQVLVIHVSLDPQHHLRLELI